MAVLGGKSIAVICLAGGVAALAGCVMLREMVSPTRKFAFSHRQHVEVEKLECANCHADALAKNEPGMPAPDTCDVCHAETDPQKPPEKRVASLFDGESYRTLHPARVSGAPSEVFFSHRMHAAGDQECAECHRGIASNERVENLPSIGMAACTACHDRKQVDAAENGGTDLGCSLCHRVVTQEWPPASHEANWKRMHGPTVRAHSEATADRCELCHTEETCSTCHQAETPQNHTPYWRQRGHGLTAMMDRENCAACHEPMSCERCHAEALPRNHTGKWGGRKNTHCLTCHQPLKSEGCVTCHPNTNSHLGAPSILSLPSNFPQHTPGMNCVQCHHSGQFLNHVDNGDDCLSCHL